MIFVPLIFSDCESTCVLIEGPASINDRKTAARPFDIIHDILWCLSQIWADGNAGVNWPKPTLASIRHTRSISLYNGEGASIRYKKGPAIRYKKGSLYKVHWSFFEELKKIFYLNWFHEKKLPGWGLKAVRKIRWVTSVTSARPQIWGQANQRAPRSDFPRVSHVLVIA